MSIASADEAGYWLKSSWIHCPSLFCVTNDWSWSDIDWTKWAFMSAVWQIQPSFIRQLVVGGKLSLAGRQEGRKDGMGWVDGWMYDWGKMSDANLDMPSVHIWINASRLKTHAQSISKWFASKCSQAEIHVRIKCKITKLLDSTCQWRHLLTHLLAKSLHETLTPKLN